MIESWPFAYCGETAISARRPGERANAPGSWPSLSTRNDMPENTSCPSCGRPIAEYGGCGPRPKHCADDACRRERARLRAAEWYAARKDDPNWRPRIAANRSRADRRWRAKNAEYVKARVADWRAGNREAIAEQYRRWRIANADTVRAKNGRRRARLLDAFVADVDPQAIWNRDRGICQLCGERIDADLIWPDPMSKTIDHVVPLAMGGTHEPANVQLAHALCNCIKGDRITAQPGAMPGHPQKRSR